MSSAFSQIFPPPFSSAVVPLRMGVSQVTGYLEEATSSLPDEVDAEQSADCPPPMLTFDSGAHQEAGAS
jgi:hypothetical protein